MRDYISPEAINELTDMSCDRIPDLFKLLEIEANPQGRRWVGPCPCHSSDKENSWNFYEEGDSARGIWQCYTEGCHTKFNKGLIGLIRSIYTYRERREYSFHDAIDLLLKFNGIKKIEDIKVGDATSTNKRVYQKIIKSLNSKSIRGESTITRVDFRKRLDIPSPYYTSRKYPPSLLDRYDVGEYNQEGRVVIPIYDDEYKWVVGSVARSIYEKCECGYYHKGECPKTTLQKSRSSKWVNSKNFYANSYLFNYWFASEHIKKGKVIVLTEGIGDVLRLEELGIHNSVCLFGTELTENQKMIIDQSGAMSVIVLLDNDGAGQKGAEKIKKKLGRSYRLFFPKITDDPGNLKSDEETKEIKKLIRKIGQ